MSQHEIVKPKFDSGQILATPGALAVLKASGQAPEVFVGAHLEGFWGGDLCEADRLVNEEALIDGSRLLSAYSTLRGERLWIITEAADDHGRRASTTIFLASEY